MNLDKTYTDDEMQEMYSKIHQIYGRWNANHDKHDWGSFSIHRGARVSVARCKRCGATKMSDGTTSPECVNEVT